LDLSLSSADAWQRIQYLQEIPFMSVEKEIEMQVDHHPGGNLTLKERHVRNGMWSDIQVQGLWCNSDAASFYQAVASRLADYAQLGVKVVGYKDTGPKLPA
jgi:hypothetical protein